MFPIENSLQLPTKKKFYIDIFNCILSRDGCQCSFVAQLTWNWLFARESGEWVLCEFRISVARGADNNIMLWFADDEYHPPGHLHRSWSSFHKHPPTHSAAVTKNDVSSLNRRAAFRMYQHYRNVLLMGSSVSYLLLIR